MPYYSIRTFELVGNNLQQNERACRPPLSAKLIKAALPAAGRPNHPSGRRL